MKKTLLPLLLASAAAGCASDSNSSADFVVRGTVESVGVASPYVGAGPKAIRTIDTVVAVPMENAMLSPTSLLELTTSKLDGLGNFSLALRRDRDYLLVLIDSTQVGVDRFVGYVAASVAGGESTLLIPASTAMAGELDVGTVSGTSTERTTTNTLDAAQMSLTPSALLDLARSDAALVNLRNLFVNWSPTTQVFFQGTMQSRFETRSGATVLRTPENVTPDANAYVGLDTWSVQVDTNAPDVTIDAFCGLTGGPIELVFPDATVRSSAGASCTVDPVTGLRSGGLASGLDAVEKGDASALPSHLALAAATTASVVPAGDFRLNVAGTTRALFDFDMARPWNASTRKPTMVVPTLRANTDATHRVTSFAIAWFAPDSSGNLVPITDTSILSHVSAFLEVKFRADDGSELEHVLIADTSTTTTIVPTATFYVSGGDPTQHLDQAVAYVNTAGVSAFLTAFYE